MLKGFSKALKRGSHISGLKFIGFSKTFLQEFLRCRILWHLRRVLCARRVEDVMEVSLIEKGLWGLSL